MEFAENGRVKLAEYEESVHQSIWIILGTAPGERVMRPDFGCGIHDLVFGLSNATTAGLIASKFGRRCCVGATDRRPRRAGDARDTGQQLLVDIDYQIRATNSRYNLVYPFYLEQGNV